MDLPRNLKAQLKAFLPFLRAGTLMLLLATLTSLVFNFLRPNPLILLPNKDATFSKISDYGRLEELLSTPGVVLLDARIKDLFQLGHLPGAKNIPPESLMDPLSPEANYLDGLKRDALIVTYCSDPLCPMAEELAGYLKGKSFETVYIFTPGFDGYLATGRQIE
ncbi:MAG: rhodanese-like domain-containing protein [Deltaproteobacteria bacterium]|jgi:rhodanese-related sulfurtransferase|nr:rhodanese-like domain-containing protein [Deltaproteobacteria bacterium]